MAFQSTSRAADVGKVMADGRVNYGGLRESIHNRPNAHKQSTRGGGSNANNRAAVIGKVMENGRTNHGGLLDSIHNRPDALQSTSRAGDIGKVKADGRVNHGGLSSNIHNRPNAPNQSTRGRRNEPNRGLGVAKAPPRRNKIETSGDHYTLELDRRNELWSGMNLKAPAAYPGCESWAIPYPAGYKFEDLVFPGYSGTCLFLDERWVRLALRTHRDPDGKELAKDLLVTPSNPFIDLRDVRLRNAMADAWWKVGRWVARVSKGERLPLIQYLEAEAKLELEQKLQRV
ncbi:hypothetical protein PG991_011863 [Apiospora marii]|uniref:Uncharacterized protein n=1 Tax=Apiospora marii TaxID=335849 RepID=A0ABR1RFA1_9PEZI